MTRAPTVALCISLALCSAGCGTTKPHGKSHGVGADSGKQPPVPQQSHRLVGVIVAVNETRGFVLIDTQASFPAPVGTALKSFANGAESGVLTVSPQAKPPFMIADIVSGTPQKGDQVFE